MSDEPEYFLCWQNEKRVDVFHPWYCSECDPVRLPVFIAEVTEKSFTRYCPNCKTVMGAGSRESWDGILNRDHKIPLIKTMNLFLGDGE